MSAGPDGPGHWWLVVADEGSGIPAEDARRIFDRFGSGDDAGGGTGIGLAIASWVCELHGGSIAADRPAPGEVGARLRVVLPRRPQPARPPQTPDPASTPPIQESPMPAPAAAAEPHGTIREQSRPVSAPAPLLDSLFGDLWPEQGFGPQVRLLLAAVGVGLLAGVVLPYRDLGVALLLVLLVGGGVVWRASRRRFARWSVATTVVCVGLAGLSVLRAADWLTVLAVLLGLVLTTTALTGARALSSVAAGVLSWPLAALRGLPLLGRTISATSRVPVLWPVARTAAISIVALVVFGGLFASGDAVFGAWASAFVPDLAWDGLVFRSFVGFVAGGALLAGAYVSLNPPRVERVVPSAPRPVARPWEWLVPVGLVVALYLAFVVAQAAALFGGHDYVQRTTGLTYAEYVHQGFGQLTVATLLTLLTVAVAARKAPRATTRDRVALRVALGALGGLTLVVVASALHRMDLYQQAYGFTVLRVLVGAFELWLGLLVLLVLVAGIRLTGWWLPRAALLSASVLLLGVGLANPEAWVATRNIDRYVATGSLDASYLRSLGADATPAIVAGLPADLARCVAHSPAAEQGWLSWNAGRSGARAAWQTLPGVALATGPADDADCTDVLAGGASGSVTTPAR